MIKNISNLGDAALYCDFGKEVNKEINSSVIKYFKTIKNKKINGINNLTPSYNKLIISYDLKKTNFKEIKKIVENIEIDQNEDLSSNKIEIPVCCDESFSFRFSKYLITVEFISLLTSSPKSQYKAASPRFDIFLIMTCYTSSIKPWKLISIVI